MIEAPRPDIADSKAQDEVRKAFVNIANQLNKELNEIRAQIAALTP